MSDVRRDQGLPSANVAMAIGGKIGKVEIWKAAQAEGQLAARREAAKRQMLVGSVARALLGLNLPTAPQSGRLAEDNEGKLGG